MTNIFKAKKSGNVYLSGDEKGIPTSRGRFAWVYLVAKRPGKQDEKTGEKWKDQFAVDLVFEKDSADTKAFTEKLIGIKNEMVKLYNEDNKTKIMVDDDDIFKDGEKNVEKEPLYAGCYVLSAVCNEPPKIFDRNVKPIDAALVKAGNIGKLVVRPKVHSKGFTYELELVQWIADDGVSFGVARADSTDVLEALGDEEFAESTKDLEGYPDAPPSESKSKGRKAAIDAI